MKNFAAALLFTTLCAQPLLAATNPWFGTWKLNKEKSTLTGDVYTINAIPGGYRFGADGVGPQYDLMEDGKDYPMYAGVTSSLVKTGTNEWLRVNKTNGKEASRTVWKLAGDGNSMTLTRTGTEADGSAYKAVRTIDRVGTGSGAAGTWKQGKYTTTEQTTIILSDAGNGNIKYEEPQSKTSFIINFDGKPVTSSGPRVSPDETQTFTRVSPTEFKYTELVKGKPVATGVQTVSADGKVISIVDWIVSKPTDRYTAIWDKQ